jgi:hypothetical protein
MLKCTCMSVGAESNHGSVHAAGDMPIVDYSAQGNCSLMKVVALQHHVSSNSEHHGCKLQVQCCCSIWLVLRGSSVLGSSTHCHTKPCPCAFRADVVVKQSQLPCSDVCELTSALSMHAPSRPHSPATPSRYLLTSGPCAGEHLGGHGPKAS